MMASLKTCVLVLTLLSGARGQIEDKAPSIDYLGTNFFLKKELKDPADYVQVAQAADGVEIVNKMTCRASNVETLKFQYAETSTDPFSDTLPSLWVGTPIRISTTEQELTITDGDTRQLEDLKPMNGYYRCVASNKAGKFETLSATFRVILPYPKVLGGAILANDAVGSPELNQPFSIPCILPDTVDDRAVPEPEDLARYTGGIELDIPQFKWEISTNTEFNNLNYDSADNLNRIKANPITGELFFAYLLDSDKRTGRDEYRCMLLIENVEAVANRVTLLVGSSSEAIPAIAYLDPKASDLTMNEATMVHEVNTEIICQEGVQCELVCIFGGLAGREGKVRWRRPGGASTSDSANGKSNYKFLPLRNSEEKWQCEVYNQTSLATIATLVFTVKVQLYPKLTDISKFAENRFESTGSNVEVVCDAENRRPFATEFYFNGQKIVEGTPSWITYDSAMDTKFTIEGAQKNMSGNILCVATNDAGTLYKTSDLTIYDEAVLVQSPLASEPYIIYRDDLNSTNTFNFLCTVTLDSNAVVEEAYWMSNKTDVKVTKKDDVGVAAVDISPNNDGEIKMSLSLDPDGSENTNNLRASKWHCAVTYSIFGHFIKTIKSDPVVFDLADKPAIAPVTAGFAHYPLIFGAVGGLLFLILLIVLINCYVQKNKGEQYYVDEKERKAGHNPEEEMEAYGFSDYTRPDQNPIKGSRASMNFSDKPMESDTGSLDEYGDVDPGRYNEDGSFIGQYGQGGPPSRHQADV